MTAQLTRPVLPEPPDVAPEPDDRPPDADSFLADLPHQTRRVHWCTCGTWDRWHEPACGLEPADDDHPLTTTAPEGAPA